MPCALCLADVELRDSHVIPEFMYDSLYDEIHRFHIISRDPGARNRMEQRGLREPLLCSTCEQQFGRYERYVSLLFSGGVPLKYETHGKLLVVRDVDYKALRLFQLSVLWRAGVSSLPFFEQVELGPHRERIRKLLRLESTGTDWHYGCLMFALVHDGQLQNDLIVQPSTTKVDDVFGYRFVFGGYVWVFLVASHQSSQMLETASLHPSGELCILRSNLASATFITEFGNELLSQGKL